MRRARIRSQLWPCLLVLGLALLACAPARAEEGIAVIVSPHGPDITFDRLTLRDVFLKRIDIDRQGQPLIPLNLPPENPLRKAFTVALLGMSTRELQAYWNRQYFHGVAPPFVANSQEAVLRIVAETPGAVGYVAACRVDDRVREVALIPLPPGAGDLFRGLCPSDGGH